MPLLVFDLDRLYQRLQASGGVGGKPLAPATVRRTHGILRRALGQGVKWGWIGVNPAAATSPQRVPASEIAPPAPSDLARVLKRAATDFPELACFLVLAAATGARRSELVTLRWSDVDLDGETVPIARGVVFGPNGLVEQGTKTHSVRRVALDARSLAVLAEHGEAMRARAEVCAAPVAPDALVFSNEADCSTPWFPDSVSRGFKRLCSKEGLVDVRLHDHAPFRRHPAPE